MHTSIRPAVLTLVVGLSLASAMCGGSSSPTSPTASTPAPTPVAGTTITIAAGGTVSPRALLVTPGARVTVINNDTRGHEIASNPHPSHVDCPAINELGFIGPGQTRQTGALTAIRTCGFHDHDAPDNASLQGTITLAN